MKVFRPAAASISLGCREFNLCLFLVWNSCVFLCVFSRFFIPSHLCGFAFAIFLIFTSCLRFCLCLSSSSSSSSFCCLLALCCLLRKLPMQKRREYFMHQHKACLAENCRLCSLLPFSFCFRWTPPTRLGDFFVAFLLPF